MFAYAHAYSEKGEVAKSEGLVALVYFSRLLEQNKILLPPKKWQLKTSNGSVVLRDPKHCLKRDTPSMDTNST